MPVFFSCLELWIWTGVSYFRYTYSLLGKNHRYDRSVKYTGVRVLGVDDNKVNLKLISRILAKYEMDVTLASSGQEAVELCKKDDFDIILMDQMMPVMDGIEAMHNIRER